MCISVLGALQRGFSHDPIFNGATEDCMVQLLGHLPVHGIDDYYIILHAHISSSYTKRDANNERGIHPSCNFMSDCVCNCLWGLGYEPRSYADVPIVQRSLQVLIVLSRQIWILPPMERYQRNLTAIGKGLISTLTPTTSTGTWIGYQILAGAGRGCGMQMVSPPTRAATKLPHLVSRLSEVLSNLASESYRMYCCLSATQRGTQ